MGNISPDTLKSMVSQAIADAEVYVHCYSGDDHFEMKVIAASFAGKSRVNRHKMVYAALGEHMRAAIHALALKTLTPEEAET
ncbi:MAG: BolA family protein [Mariprofundaceae bacterium]|nr:BolA family protein [Mariprofundaceae bacterium]